jgi:hypothetical protein
MDGSYCEDHSRVEPEWAVPASWYQLQVVFLVNGLEESSAPELEITKYAFVDIFVGNFEIIFVVA